jgi:5,6,7,8-tetrahydromethanopterin hydro-lyase
MEIGEAFAGGGAEAAHINTILGARNGPVGTAFATALSSPTIGHIPFLVVWEPDVPVTPATVFINKAAIASDGHGALTWGAAQAGVALGVTRFTSERYPGPGETDGLVLIAAVWVDPGASDERSVLDNNAEATYNALSRGSRSPQPLAAVDAFRRGGRPTNPYLRSDTTDHP